MFIAVGLLVGALLTPVSQAVQPQAPPEEIWPPLYQNQWHWHELRDTLAPAQAGALLASLAAERPALIHPEFYNTIFMIKGIEAGTKSKVSGIKIDADWVATNGKGHGRKSLFVPLAPVTGMTLWYSTESTGRKWEVRVFPAPTSVFTFTTERAARSFMDAVHAFRANKDPSQRWEKFGMMTQDLDPKQAADAGRSRVDCVYVGMVAINGPADQAGIHAYDVITVFNSKNVINEDQFESLVREVQPGSSVTVSFLRREKAPESSKSAYVWETKTAQLTAK